MNPNAVDRIVAYRLGLRQVRQLCAAHLSPCICCVFHRVLLFSHHEILLNPDSDPDVFSLVNHLTFEKVNVGDSRSTENPSGSLGSPRSALHLKLSQRGRSGDPAERNPKCSSCSRAPAGSVDGRVLPLPLFASRPPLVVSSWCTRCHLLLRRRHR